MNGRDFKKELYKYWDASPAYYETAENTHPDTERKYRAIFSSIKEGGKVLDIACGSGVNRKELPKGIFYCGIDLSFAGLSAAKRRFQEDSFVKADAENLPTINGLFDYVISTNAVEHFLEPKLVFNEMWRACKKGGCILLVFPNFGDYIFKYPPSVSHMMKSPGYRIKYIARQFYRQTLRIFMRRSFFFAKIDTIPAVLIDSYTPDTDIIYLASGREVKSYFESLGASSIRVESREGFSFAKPFLRNTARNIFRLYKAVNPYYSWHGDTILVIRK